MASFNIDTTGEQIVAKFGINANSRTFVITGPSAGGLGAELLVTLARANPAHFILAGRNEDKIYPVIDQIRKVNPNIKTTFIFLDLLDNLSVRKAAAEINATAASIDVLINNAGVAAKKEFSLSKDGVEGHLAANYLGHFVLTNILAAKIIASKGIVLNVTSMAYTLAETNTDNPNFDDGKDYNPWIAYGRSKTANILFTWALAEKYDGELISLVADPGMAHDSQLLVNSAVDDDFLAEGFAIAAERMKGQQVPKTVLVSMQQGIATQLRAILDPGLRDRSPAFLKESNIIPVLPYARNKEEALKLWSWSESVAGESFGSS